MRGGLADDLEHKHAIESVMAGTGAALASHARSKHLPIQEIKAPVAIARRKRIPIGGVDQGEPGCKFTADIGVYTGACSGLQNRGRGLRAGPSAVCTLGAEPCRTAASKER